MWVLEAHIPQIILSKFSELCMGEAIRLRLVETYTCRCMYASYLAGVVITEACATELVGPSCVQKFGDDGEGCDPPKCLRVFFALIDFIPSRTVKMLCGRIRSKFCSALW